MVKNGTILFKINYLSGSSIPIEIINRVTNYLPDGVDVYVFALFENSDRSEQLPISGENLTIVRCNLANKWDLFKSIPHLLGIVREISPDVIHTNHKYSSWLLGYKPFVPATNFVHTVHNDFIHYNKSGRLDLLPVFQFYDDIIYNSNHTRDSWPSRYRGGSATEHVVYNGINRALLDSAKTDRNADNTVRILSGGRFVKQKKFKMALNAVGNLVDQGYDNLRFILTGHGHLSEDYKYIVSRRNIEQYVSFPGFVSREKVYRRMWHSDIYLITSLYEGFCNAAVEAMFTDNVVVSSNIEPLRSEVIGDHGVFFESDDLDSLVKTLRPIINNFDAYEDVRTKLAERARSNFELDLTAHEYTNIYRRALSR